MKTKHKTGVLKLLFSIAAFSILSSGGFASNVNTLSGQDIEIIRERAREYIMRSDVNEELVETNLTELNSQGYWPDINYEDVSRTGFQHSEHLANMQRMALAYKKPGNRFTGDQNLKNAVHRALDFWIENDFICDNWWWNDMGTPLMMINLLMIMDDEVTDHQRAEGLRIAGRAHMQSAGARPGGDLIRVATIWGKQGLYKRDADILEEVIEVMASEMHTTTGRGMKPDLSHHHRNDGVISTLTYGMYLPGQFSLWARFIEGTRFTFPEPAMELLVDYFLDGVCRSMVYGKYPDPGARNRGISRRGALNPASAEIAENLVASTHYRRDELEKIAMIRRNEIEPDLRYTSFFWHSEYFVHQRPGWFASVRLHSSRNNNVESPYNGEGLLNHHYADGSNFLTKTAGEYREIFPVWNWQRVPGTTVVQKPSLPHWDEIVKRGRRSFVGGVTDDEYGAAVFDFESPHDPLEARKSWFFFDNEYVALGSGITSTSRFPVNTTISQRYLEDDVWVSGTGNIMRPLLRGEHEIENTYWVHHDNVAYLFPSNNNISIRNTASRGNWRRINHSHWATEEPVVADLFTIWFDHGAEPSGCSYEYVVVPEIELGFVDCYNRNMPVRILSNTTGIQAVTHDRLGVTQVVFYEPGEIEIDNGLVLASDTPSLVMVKTGRRNRVERVTVADPSRDKERIELTISSRVRGSGDNWSSEWTRREGVSRITIDLPVEEMAGQSVVIDF